MPSLPTTMKAILLTGHGGLDKLDVRDDYPKPVPGPGEVLIRVGACGINNTDINTRVGWYARGVNEDGATWASDMVFPHIQGADIAGTISAVGPDIPERRIGARVVVDPVLRNPEDPMNLDTVGYVGAHCFGGFAEYVLVPEQNALPITSDLSDAELASFPCSSSTAENMLERAHVADGETVLVTGASGGVGSALVQLAKRRGAFVIAVTRAAKFDAVKDFGADALIDRATTDFAADVRAAAPNGVIDVAADVVGGDGFESLLASVRKGGRYVVSGAIAGPLVSLDLRTLYLRDLDMIGTTILLPQVFPNLVGYIQAGEIRPLVAQTYPLDKIAEAQTAFTEKKHVGNIVLIP